MRKSIYKSTEKSAHISEDQLIIQQKLHTFSYIQIISKVMILPSIFELPLPASTFSFFESHGKVVPEFQQQQPENKATIQKGIWTNEEDCLLRQAISESNAPVNWEKIAQFVKGRSAKQCRERWQFRLCPTVNKEPFQKWEDELIVIERQRIGNHWKAIAQKLPGRTSCAVKNRWYTVLRNRVSPSLIFNRPVFTQVQIPVSC